MPKSQKETVVMTTTDNRFKYTSWLVIVMIGIFGILSGVNLYAMGRIEDKYDKNIGALSKEFATKDDVLKNRKAIEELACDFIPKEQYRLDINRIEQAVNVGIKKAIEEMPIRFVAKDQYRIDTQRIEKAIESTTNRLAIKIDKLADKWMVP